MLSLDRLFLKEILLMTFCCMLFYQCYFDACYFVNAILMYVSLSMYFYDN